jgi:hypothetical protein
MSSNSFLGADETAWVGISCLTALLVAVGGIAWPLAYRWWKSPKLSIDPSGSEALSTEIDNNLWVRVPVKNAQGKFTAKNVEVFLEGVRQPGNNPEVPPGFLPMRLQWSHTAEPTCKRISAETYRILDLGVYLEIGEIEFVARPPRQVPYFRFCGEILAHAPRVAGNHPVKISVILSADNAKPRKQLLKLTLSTDNGHMSARVELD